MRLIEQFSRTLGELTGLKQQQKPQQALAAIDELLQGLMRLNSRTIDALSEQDLLALMSTNGMIESEKLLIVARLLKEEGDIYAAQGDSQASGRRHLKALNLFLAAARTGADTKLVDYHAEIDELTERLRGFELPVATQRELWRYFEAAGRYADAEDVLFELLDAEADERLIAEGLQFYERLLAKDDAELAAGRLPRDEIGDAVEQLQAMRHEATGA